MAAKILNVHIDPLSTVINEKFSIDSNIFLRLSEFRQTEFVFGGGF